MRNRYDMQLHLLDTQLTHMGELCETAIAKVTQALKEGNTEQAKIVIKEDEEIDQIEKDIERLCLKLLLQQQPVARDLRRISAALKMITDMERIGDQTSDIAEIIISSKWEKMDENLDKLTAMATGVSKMVRNSVTAYVEKDLELARTVMNDDDEIDDYFDLDTGELILGDIVISYDRVISQAHEFNHSVRREFAFLVAHSMLHLFGYDHMEEDERVEMERKQNDILINLGITRE